MYTAKHFENTNTEQIKEFIRLNAFGILVTQANGRPLATHIPMQLSEDGTRLHGHVARANEQWKDFNSLNEVMAIFTGPHAYISPSWYDQKNVPTWNYQAVHAYGPIRIIEGQELYDSLKTLVDNHEKHVATPVTLEKLGAQYVEQSIKGLVGFEITISTIQANYKLSQNRNDASYKNIIHELKKQQNQNSQQIAELMKKNRAL